MPDDLTAPPEKLTTFLRFARHPGRMQEIILGTQMTCSLQEKNCGFLF